MHCSFVTGSRAEGEALGVSESTGENRPVTLGLQQSDNSTFTINSHGLGHLPKVMGLNNTQI